MESYYYNSSTILKYLRKVLNEIHGDYVDSGIRAGFIMKRFGERYKFNENALAKLVLLCILKDIGCFYQDGIIDSDNEALVAASSYCFLKHCSPLNDAAKPLLFYNAKYMPGITDEDYYCGLLITLINQVVRYQFDDYSIDEMEEALMSDESGRYHPEQIKKLMNLLREDEDIISKLNQKNSLFVHEACAFIQNAEYTDEELLRYIDMTNFSFEFHNHETLAHTVTTAAIAKELAKLSRLTESQINCIYLAALIHDIGKIKVPVSVLCHPGRLEGDMLKEMRKHVVYTKEILEGSFSYKIVEIAANHHEKLDGSGYPRGLHALDLSIGDKIIAIADVASALYCRRSYKKSFSKEQIMDILIKDAEAGKNDTRITNHFINNFDSIMAIAKEEEARVLTQYNAMKEEYDALANSPQLLTFFGIDPTKEEKKEDHLNWTKNFDGWFESHKEELDDSSLQEETESDLELVEDEPEDDEEDTEEVLIEENPDEEEEVLEEETEEPEDDTDLDFLNDEE